MSAHVHRSNKVRELVVRLGAGSLLPSALLEVLRAEGVACGHLRANGVLEDVDLFVMDAGPGGLSHVRRIAGPVRLVTAEATIGMTEGRTAISLRCVLARETEVGLETIAGEIRLARSLAVEAFVTSFDDLGLERTFEKAGVWLLGPSPAGARAGWSAAVEASATAEREPAREQTAATAAGRAGAAVAGGPSPPGVPVPPRRPRASDLDAPAPEAPEPGDVVDHFAFGRCDVLKSDGDRLHLRVHKDGRIREIALEMLRVTPLDGAQGVQYKLERRI